MDFKQLETFITIAKLKSFSKAADHLFLTQPTISNHIQNLEKELNTVLFNRYNKSITLTKAGRILYKHAIEILNKKEAALFSLNEFMGKIDGILEISASTIPEQYFLPDIILDFNKIYPEVQYSLKKYDTAEIVDKTLNGDIDFGIVGAKEEHKQLDYLEIMEDNIVFVVPNIEPYKELSTLDLGQLKSMPLILREEGSGTRKALENKLLKKDITIDDLNIVAYVENTTTIKEFIKKGFGSSFISERAVRRELESNKFKKIIISDFEILRNFYFVYHNNRSLSPLAQTFKDFLLESVKKTKL